MAGCPTPRVSCCSTSTASRPCHRVPARSGSFTAPPVAERQSVAGDRSPRPAVASARESDLVRDLAAVLGMAADGTPEPEAPPAGGAAAEAEAEACRVLDFSVAAQAWAGAGPDGLFRQAVRAEDAGQWQLARHLYERALAAGEPDPETCFNLGNVLYELDRKRAAARRYLQAVALDAEYVESLNNLGNALAESGWLHEAVRAYRRALQLEPAYADAHSNLAETLVYLGRYAEARLHWTAISRSTPTVPGPTPSANCCATSPPTATEAGAVGDAVRVHTRMRSIGRANEPRGVRRYGVTSCRES